MAPANASVMMMLGYQIHYIVVKMKVIYMQDTIEYFIREKNLLNEF